MKTWQGKKENVEKAQAMFLERCRLCSKASLGQLQVDKKDACTSNVKD